MKLVDPSGKEVTSKENKKAKALEEQMAKHAEKIVEPILNKIKLSGSQIPQDQLMQLFSMAQSTLFNRMVFNLAVKMGVEDMGDLLTEDDVEELKTNLSNQVQMVDPNEAQPNDPNQGPQA